MPYYFLPDDLEALDREIEKKKKEQKEALRRIGDSSDEGVSDWHDNFDFEQAQRDVEMCSSRVRELVSVRNNVKIVYPDDFGDDKVNIGKIVTIRNEDSGETKSFKVGSYMIMGRKKNVISYRAPLIQLLMGAKVGEIRKGKVGEGEKKFKIVKIE